MKDEELEDLEQLGHCIGKLLNEFMIEEYVYELRDQEGNIILQVERSDI